MRQNEQKTDLKRPSSQNEQKTDLKKSQICPGWWLSSQILGQICQPCLQQVIPEQLIPLHTVAALKPISLHQLHNKIK